MSNPLKKSEGCQEQSISLPKPFTNEEAKWKNLPTSKKAQYERKIDEITQLLAEDNVDLWKLRELCLTDGGLITDALRKKAWPKLVGLSLLNNYSATKACNSQDIDTNFLSIPGVEVDDLTSLKLGGNKCSIARCLDFEQIDRDVSRCTWHLLTGSQRLRNRQMKNKHKKKVASLLKRKQRKLGNLINLVLIQSYDGIKNPTERMRYYQGYHDISCIFLSVLDGGSSLSNHGIMLEHDRNSEVNLSNSALETSYKLGMGLTSQVLLQVSKSHFNDAMKENFNKLSEALQLIIMPLFGVLDSEMHAFLAKADIQPFFAISWIITWFSHNIRDTALVKRLFDVFIVSHPLMPIYMSIAMVLHPVNRDEVLNTECDFASVHNTLSWLPHNSCNDLNYIDNPQDGIDIIDEEEDGDRMSVDTSFMSFGDKIDTVTGDDDTISVAPSLASSVDCGSNVRVSFEELIELSIKYMRRIPPRNLIPLARKYLSDENCQLLLAGSSSIALLQPPPSWALVNTVPADWILKMQLREFQGQASSNRRGRRVRKRDRTLVGDLNSKNGEQNVGGSSVTTNINTNRKISESTFAIIAIGIGPDGDADRKRDKIRKKMKIVSAICVGLISISLGVSKNDGVSYFLSPTLSHLQKMKNIFDNYSKDKMKEEGYDISFQKSIMQIEIDQEKCSLQLIEKVTETPLVVEEHKSDTKEIKRKRGPIQFFTSMVQVAKDELAEHAEAIAL